MEHRMNYNDTLLEYAKHQEEAKKILNPSCRVCKICNGRACAGRFTNTLEFGSKGNNGWRTSASRWTPFTRTMSPIPLLSCSAASSMCPSSRLPSP